MSGGRATVHQGKKEDVSAHAGDIVATHPLGNFLMERFVIEVKHYKDFNIQANAFAARSQLTDFWRVLNVVAEQSKRKPILIAKQDHRGEILCVNGHTAFLLEKVSAGKVKPTMYLPRYDLWSYLFRDVLADIEFDKIRERLAHHKGTDESNPDSRLASDGEAAG
jgi:hypothetical protein